MKNLILFIFPFFLFQSCEPCLSGSELDSKINECYSTSFSQTKTQIATGVVKVTFNNTCNDLPMTITKVGIKFKPYAGMGETAVKTKKDKFLVSPGSSIIREYNLDVGDKVINAYAYRNSIQFCE